MVTTFNGRTIYHAKPAPKNLVNAWPDWLEAEFQDRAHAIVTAQRRDTKAGVNTYFENEKRSYGFLMAHVLGGNADAALKYLQAQDHQHDQWHRETEGIDYYACFTLKHQIRKYFYFGDLLEPAYRQRMFDGAKLWTAQDPLRRPHYAHQPNTSGWGPDAHNSWVDVRSTENLFLMRVTSVYMMAEETGNHATTAKYRQQILDYTKTLYRVGIGEWDSENYHGHSIAPLLNLYDFAKDREVKAAAKACLDFCAVAGAIKYWRGGFNGPTKRDYNHAQPFGGSAPNSLWVWFGEHPQGKSDHWESDEVHQITSAYRPPLAAVHLARKRFEKPVEIFAAKPPYSATTKGQHDSRAEYLETQFIAHSFQMGSLTSGTSVDGGDTNGFKILAYDDEQGAVALHAAPTANPVYPGSPMYKQGVIAAENRVAQLENVAIWLVKDGKSPWLWVVPDSVAVTLEKGITLLSCDRTWVAVWGLGTSVVHEDPTLTETLLNEKKSRFPGHKVLSARGEASKFCGLAILVGEKESHGTFAQFRTAAKAMRINQSGLDRGRAELQTSQGKKLAMQWHDDPLQLGVIRNGVKRDLSDYALYRSPIVRSGWHSGTLTVNAGGETFSCYVDETGVPKFDL